MCTGFEAFGRGGVVVRSRRRRWRGFPLEAVVDVPEESVRARVPAWEREYGCCAVQRVRGWLGGTVVVTTVHALGCPVWSAR